MMLMRLTVVKRIRKARLQKKYFIDVIEHVTSVGLSGESN